MQYRILGSTGVSVSVVGFGASPLGNVFHAIDRAEGEKAVHAAVDGGINLFDVSPYYGATLAETRLGEALSGRRNRVFLASKCGRHGFNRFDFSAPGVRKSVEESLKRLRTDYLDLLQVHDVEFADACQVVNETVPALHAIQQEGKARFIGITGYPLRALRTIAASVPVDTILSYCHYNLLATDLDVFLTGFVRERQIGLINASPLHMGILSEAGAPAWHPASAAVKQAGARVVDACRKQGVSPGVVALRFCLNHAYASSTLVGMSETGHVEESLRALTFDPDPYLLRTIESLVAPVRNLAWPSGRSENDSDEVACCPLPLER